MHIFWKTAGLSTLLLCLVSTTTIAAQCDYYKYRGVARKSMKELKQKKPKVEKIRHLADELIDEGVCYAKTFLEHKMEMWVPDEDNFRQQCVQFLELYINDAHRMKKVTLDIMEDLYQDGEIVDDLDIDIDDHELRACVELSHLIVHPATVIILLKLYEEEDDKDYLRDAKGELLEALSDLHDIHSKMKRGPKRYK